MGNVAWTKIEGVEHTVVRCMCNLNSTKASVFDQGLSTVQGKIVGDVNVVNSK